MKYSRVYIWGPNPFTNRLLASHIQSIIGFEPNCLCAFENIDSNVYDAGSIVFCDCGKTNPVSYCRALHRSGYDSRSIPGITLINVQPQLDLLDEIKAFDIHGIFYSNDTFELIDKGIRKVLSGGHWLSRDLLVRTLQSVRREMRQGKDDRMLSTLTFREQEILRMIVAGHDNQTIADKLFISPNTVKTHVSNIYKKIDATNRVQAIIWATDNALHLSQSYAAPAGSGPMVESTDLHRV